KRAVGVGATLSIVAIGDVADAGRLADVAARGGGAFHQTHDFRALPAIMSQEALMFDGSPFEKRQASATWIDKDPSFFAGLPDRLPPIQSYMKTSLKPGARLHMAMEEPDGSSTPILASWRYGLGNVLSVATHGAGPGVVDWSKLAEYPLLFAQPLRQ